MSETRARLIQLLRAATGSRGDCPDCTGCYGGHLPGCSFDWVEGLAKDNAALRAEVERLRAEAVTTHAANDDLVSRHLARESRLAAAIELLERIVKYACEDNARTPGTTRLARALDDVNTFLAAQPAAPGAPPPPASDGLRCAFGR